MRLSRRLRDFPGVLLRDVPRYAAALSGSSGTSGANVDGWLSLCNRNERLIADSGHSGVVCDWQWGSALHAPEVLPALGRRLMRKALAKWPIRFSERPVASDDAPKITFIIAIGGARRIPQLNLTLRSLFAQEGVACEYIIVDQTPEPQFAKLPLGIVYRHLDKSGVPEGWYKSWAFNVGARLARSNILVFHDGDICAPIGYARELLKTFADGRCGAASIQRFLFYLDAADTARVMVNEGIPENCTPRPVFQNWKGGTIAVRRETFFDLGGFDEGFVDWGGEDDEFHDRCGEVGHRRVGYLPFVHLWHAPQAFRMTAENVNTAQILPMRLSIPRTQRIADLTSRNWGHGGRPDPVARYG